jgi:hypothetical protein
MPAERGREPTRATTEAAYRLTLGPPPERWPEISRVVDAALELPPEERSAFV